MRHFSTILAVAAGSFAASLHSVELSAADGPWFVSTDAQAMAAGFGGGDRDAMALAGVFVTADYLDSGAVAVGINGARLAFADDSPDTDQRNLYLSGRRHFRPDRLPGMVTLRLDAHSIDNDADDSGTGDVTVVAPIVSYLSYSQSLYLELGYAESSYGASASSAEELTVEQWTPAIGFALNDRYDWLLIRAYRLEFSSRERAQGQPDATAVELKWTHWFERRGPLGADSIRAGLLAGDRLFAVDHDAAGVYNLTDRQTAGASLGLEWRIRDRDRVLLLISGERYENAAAESYRGTALYLNWHRDWN